MRPRADALVLVVVDGWEQVLDAWLPVEHGRLVDDLLRLARDGLGAGVRFLVTGGRTLLGGAVGGVLTERLLLRPADPTDLVLAGVPARELPASMPPGRVVRVGGGSVVEAQVVLDDPATDPACRHVGPGERAPLRLAPLPDVVTTTQLIAQLAAAPGGVSAALADGLLPLGLGGDDARPLGPPGRGPGWLVAGAPGSGRSTALATAARVLRAGGRPVVTVAASPSPLADVPPVDGTTVSPAALRSGTTDLLRMLDALPRATLVLDDVMVLADTRAEDDLLARLEGHGPGAVSWPDGPGPHVLAGCAPGQAAMAFRGLAARLRTSGAGLLLTPCGPGDGEAFGVRVPAAGGGPPGRALVVTASGVQAVQVAGG